MQYLFECIECKNQEEKTIKMADYDNEKDNQKCTKCSGFMNRVFEPMQGSVKLCNGMYGVNGWNK